jgi:phage terminase large subunit GpA-like protein
MIPGLARGLRIEDHPAWESIMQFRAAIPLHEWTAQHRRLSERTTAPGLAGPWRWEVAPVMLDPYVVYSDVRVQSVAVCGCTQYGKSEFGHNVAAWTVLCDPAPLLLVMPTEDEVKNRVAIRLRDLFKSHPDLLATIGGDERNIHVDRATDCRSCLLYLGWPNSPVTLGDKAVGRVILDELKNFPTEIKDHGDPVALARDRLRTFGAFGKLLSVSSPTTAESLIARELERGDYRTAHLPCPHCAVYQYPAWENVQIDRDSDGHLLPPDDYAAGGHARYVCPHCRQPWTETDRLRALYRLVWLPEGVTVTHARPGLTLDELPTYDALAGWTHRHAPEALPDVYPTIRFAWGEDTTPPSAPPSTVSYAEISALHLHPTFETADRAVSQWAQAEAERLRGDPAAMRVFINNQLGREYTDAAATFDESRVNKRRTGYTAGAVPAPGPGSLGPELVTVGLDVHAANVVAAAWAWGYGAEAWLLSCVTIHVSDSRDVANWQPVTLWCQALAGVLAHHQGPPGPAGVRPALRVNFGLIDHRYQPGAVETWCARVAGLWPIEPAEGIEDRPMAAMITTSRLSAKRHETRRKRRRLDPTMPVQRLNVNALKDRFSRLLENDGDGPGRVHFPDKGLPADFATQFASEVRVPFPGRQKGHHWIPRYKGIPNHYWDASIYAYAAAILAGVTNLLAPDQRTKTAPIRLSDHR